MPQDVSRFEEEAFKLGEGNLVRVHAMICMIVQALERFPHFGDSARITSPKSL
jgi:hypothetical protein